MGEFPNCDIKLCDLEVARVIQPGESISELVGTLDYVGKNLSDFFTYKITNPSTAPITIRDLTLFFLLFQHLKY